MNTVTVTNQSMTLMFLQYVIEKMDSSAEALDELLGCGYSPEFLDNLRHRAHRDLKHLAQHANLSLLVQVKEPQALDRCLRNLDRERRDKELAEYFVRNGASRELMGTLFKLSAETIREMREQLLPERAAASGGRTKLPAPAVRDQIHQAWHALQKACPTLPRRELIYELHQDFLSYGLEALWGTLHEFDDAVTPLKDGPRKAASRGLARPPSHMAAQA